MSLGHRLFEKSIRFSVWHLLTLPRDTLRSRQYATWISGSPPRRFLEQPYSLPQPHATQRRATPDPKPQSDDLTGADIIHGENPTAEPASREELHGSCGWANGVLWADTHSDVDLGYYPNMAQPRKRDKPMEQRNYAATRLENYRRGKALELKQIQRIDEKRSEIQWRHSLGLLIAHTDTKGNSLSQDALENCDQDQDQDRGGRQAYRFTQIAADQIPRPRTWSTDNFREYVAALVTSTADGTYHRNLYRGGDYHLKNVARILHQLFEDPKWNAYVSISACNMALPFFYKLSQFSEARSILSLMEERGLMTSSESFNLVLRGSAHLKNVNNFEYILEQMIERGVKPNAETWMIFYSITNSDQAKSEVYHCMRDKGVLQDPVAMRRFMKLSIRRVLVRWFEKGRSINSLLEYLNGLDRKIWRSVNVANNILHEIGKRGPIQDVIKVLDQLEQLGMIFDEVTLNTMLHRCLPHRDHDDAIEIIRRFRQRYNILPGRLSYDTLFRQAWHSHLYNFAKVIWWYACSQDFVTNRMTTCVRQSLWQYVPAKPDEQSFTRGAMWRAAAGKLVVGSSSDLKPDDTSHRTSSSTTVLETKETTTPAPSDHKGKKVQNRWIELFWQDITHPYHFQARWDLDKVLSRALALDRQWALEAVSTQKSFEWMLQHSINVEWSKTYSARLLVSNCRNHASERYSEDQHPLYIQDGEDPEGD